MEGFRNKPFIKATFYSLERLSSNHPSPSGHTGPHWPASDLDLSSVLVPD